MTFLIRATGTTRYHKVPQGTTCTATIDWPEVLQVYYCVLQNLELTGVFANGLAMTKKIQ